MVRKDSGLTFEQRLEGKVWVRCSDKGDKVIKMSEEHKQREVGDGSACIKAKQQPGRDSRHQDDREDPAFISIRLHRLRLFSKCNGKPMEGFEH